MKNDRLTYWCLSATSEIKYKPDRERVYGELRLHVEDRKESFLARGFSEQEAIDKTIEAMGKPESIAPQLGEIHSPFWGYLLRAARIMLVILLCISLLSVHRYIKKNNYSDNYFNDFDVYDTASYGPDSGRTLLHLSQPDVSFSSDGSTFTLTDAAVFRNDETGMVQLYVNIEQTSLLPQKEHKEYFDSIPFSFLFSARDSLGNEYTNWYGIEDGGRWVNGHIAQRDLFSCVHECWIVHFPEEAQWVEICYERDGRSYSLRIDLTGGDCT